MKILFHLLLICILFSCSEADQCYSCKEIVSTNEIAILDQISRTGRYSDSPHFDVVRSSSVEFCGDRLSVGSQINSSKKDTFMGRFGYAFTYKVRAECEGF